jgi:hypothetical protein
MFSENVYCADGHLGKSLRSDMVVSNFDCSELRSTWS